MFTAPVRGTANRAYTRNLQPQAHTHWPDECQCLSGRGRPSGRLRPLSYGGGSRTDIREAVACHLSQWPRPASAAYECRVGRRSVSGGDRSCELNFGPVGQRGLFLGDLLGRAAASSQAQ